MDPPEIELPESFITYDNYFIYPQPFREGLELVMGPNIKPFPLNSPLLTEISGCILLKAADNITTDDIMPSDAKLLPFRSNIPELSKYCFGTLTTDFREKALSFGGGFVIGGENYGQGSSREHAALVPLYLGVKAVLAKSFARIHKANLINSGILPLVFTDKEDYQTIDEFDEIILENIIECLDSDKPIKVLNKTKETHVFVKFEGSDYDIALLKAGGYLNHIKSL
jgi:aconitate hydratase